MKPEVLERRVSPGVMPIRRRQSDAERLHTILVDDIQDNAWNETGTSCGVLLNDLIEFRHDESSGGVVCFCVFVFEVVRDKR